MNIVCGIGLTPWLLYWLKVKNTNFKGKISLLIFLNGIMHHICYNNLYSRIYDLCMNLYFIVYINTHTKYKRTSLTISILASLIYLYNTKWRKKTNEYIHIIGVSWFLMIPYHLSLK